MRGIIFICTTLLCLTASSQTELKVSEKHGEYFKQRGRSVVDVFENPSGGYWSIGGGFVQKLDEDLNLIEQKRLDLFYNGKDLKLEKVIRFQNEYYLFMSFINKKKRKKYLFYSRFDPYDLKPEGDLFKIGELKAATKRGMKPSSYDIQVSENERFLLIMGYDAQTVPRRKFSFFRRAEADEVGDRVFNFSFWVLNQDFTTVNYEKKYELEIENSSDRFYIRQFSVDDSGSVYILGKNKVIDNMSLTTRERLRSRAGGLKIVTSAYILEKIDPDGFSYQFNTSQEKAFVDMRLLFNASNEAVLIGLSGDVIGDRMYSTGIYSAKLDKELNMLSETESNFSEEVLNGVNNIREREARMSERRRRRRERRQERKSDEQQEEMRIAKMAALNINTIEFAQIDEQGDAVLILEEQYVRVVETTTRNANGTTTTTRTYYYHYEDLILAKVMGDTIVQNFYNKYYVLANLPLAKSLEASLTNGEMTIISQENILRVNQDLSNVKAYDFESIESEGGRSSRRNIFLYRKTLNDNVIMALARKGKKFQWFRYEIRD